MPAQTTRRCALLALSAAALGVPTAAHAAPTAAPNTYEQISRASGSTGAAQIETKLRPDPSWVSDLGVSAAYTKSPSAFNLEFGPKSAVLRNTVTNKTRDLGTNVGELLAADRLESVGLFRRQVVISEQEREFVFSVGTIDGRNRHDIPGIDDGSVPPQLSGNGKFVVTSDRGGLRRYDIARRQWTQIAPLGYIANYSVSDDGQSIAAVDFDQEAQRIDAVVWKNGQRKLLVEGYGYRGPGTDVLLSPDGSTAFTVEVIDSEEGAGVSKLISHRLANGTTKTTEIPFEQTWSARPLWIAPNGSKIAWALQAQSSIFGEIQPAKVWTVGGRWAPFGGAFATSIQGDGGIYSPATKISRNGLFAAIAYNQQVAVASLSGLPLLGNLAGREGLSATSYLEHFGLDFCGFGFSSVFSAGFVKPAAWVPAPRTARITVSNGATVLADEQWTKPAPQLSASGEGYDYVSVNFPLGTAHTRNLALSVVDGNGRTLNEKQSANVTCGAISG